MIDTEPGSATRTPLTLEEFQSLDVGDVIERIGESPMHGQMEFDVLCQVPVPADWGPRVLLRSRKYPQRPEFTSRRYSDFALVSKAEPKPVVIDIEEVLDRMAAEVTASPPRWVPSPRQIRGVDRLFVATVFSSLFAGANVAAISDPSIHPDALLWASTMIALVLTIGLSAGVSTRLDGIARRLEGTVSKEAERG